MNWSDVGVFAIILGFGLLGLKIGLVLSIFKIASYFLSIWISIKFYPKLAEILMKTQLYENIRNSILANLLRQKETLALQAGEQMKQTTTSSVIERLPLPGFLKDGIVNKIPNPGSLIDIEGVMDTVSGELSKIIIYILSMILLYIFVRIAIILVKNLLKGVTRLPVIKQLDKLGGFAFGAVEGLLTVYIIFALIMLFNTSPSFRQIYENIEASKVARFFYENNFIVDFMFPNKII